VAETRFAGRFRKVVAALRARGFAVVEEPGCYSRTVGEGTSGEKDLLDVRSHLVHHTAGGSDASDRRVVRGGRPGLRGPLAQWLTERDGTLRLLASGYANHAGPTRRRDEGNSYSTGNEIVSAGLRASDFNPAQVTASEALAEEMAREFGYDLDDWTVGHKEAGVPRGRKVDPAFSMPEFRARLSTTATPITPEEGFLMALSDDQQAELLQKVREIPTAAQLDERINGALDAHRSGYAGAVWDRGLGKDPLDEARTVTAKDALVGVRRDASFGRRYAIAAATSTTSAADQARAASADLLEAIDELPADIAAAVRRDLARALAAEAAGTVTAATTATAVTR